MNAESIVLLFLVVIMLAAMVGTALSTLARRVKAREAAGKAQSEPAGLADPTAADAARPEGHESERRSAASASHAAT